MGVEQCGELAEGDDEVVKDLPQLIAGSHRCTLTAIQSVVITFCEVVYTCNTKHMQEYL